MKYWIKKLELLIGLMWILLCLCSGCSNGTKTPAALIRSTFIACQNLPYVDISTNANFEHYIASIKINSDENINIDQQEKLNASLLDMFHAYHDGNYDTYMAFRTPGLLKWTMDPDAINIMLGLWSSATNVAPPTNDKDLWVWYLRNVSGGNYYKDFWTGVCIDPQILNAQLGPANGFMNYGIEIHKMNKMTTLYWEFHDLDQRTNLMWGLYYTTTYFREEVTPRKLIESRGYLLVADIYCFIRRDPPYPPQPLFARFYWSDSIRGWVPMDLAIGALRHVGAYNHVRVTAF